MHKRRLTAVVVLLLLAGLFVAGSSSARSTTVPASGRYLVIAKSNADYTALHADLTKAGVTVVLSMPAINTDVITGDVSSLGTNPHVDSVVPDRIETLVRPAVKDELFGSSGRQTIQGDGANASIVKDPAFSLPGLLWNVRRIDAPKAWSTTIGSSDVLVGVADTGLDYTHDELSSQVASVVDFTKTEDPPLCKTFFGTSDEDLAAQLGAPSDNLDFHGHGSWIGGNIAAALNGSGINGIAPGIKLVSLKIAQWCGFAYDSTILNAFIWAADHQLDVVSISFGGYLDRSDPQQNAIYKLYVSTVKYARSFGTTIVAAAGNEHTRIGAGGEVISHGILDVPPGGTDFFGLFELPGGVPGVVDVAATGNVVKAPSKNCPADSLGAGSHQWCKPKSDPHQSYGVGLQNQLTYYSNYGPRIDVAGPGGARKFNLPSIDRGGTEGWPWTGIDSVFGGTSTSDGYNAWQAFSITSNWAQQIPCFTFVGFAPFPDNQCYAIIQGTSMATPHASATLALLISAHPELRHKVGKLIEALKASAEPITGNTTPGVSATDTSPGDRGGPDCPGGYCHFGGPAIPDSEAYGAGLVNAANAVK
jgi:subtilisin family serine protease